MDMSIYLACMWMLFNQFLSSSSSFFDNLHVATGLYCTRKRHQSSLGDSQYYIIDKTYLKEQRKTHPLVIGVVLFRLLIVEIVRDAGLCHVDANLQNGNGLWLQAHNAQDKCI